MKEFSVHIKSELIAEYENHTTWALFMDEKFFGVIGVKQ